MPKPPWNKQILSTYLSPEQKELWTKIAKSERRAIADFVRDRVQSTIDNKDLNGKICIWLDIPQELIDKSRFIDKTPEGKKAKKTQSNIERHEEDLKPELDELIQNYVYRMVKEDAENEIMWERSAIDPDKESLKAEILNLLKQIEALKFENASLRNRSAVSESNEIYKVLDKEKFLSLEKIAVLLNRGDDDNEIHNLYEELQETMFNIGMIEFKEGRNGGYRFNPDIEPVERVYSSRIIKIQGDSNETNK